MFMYVHVYVSFCCILLGEPPEGELQLPLEEVAEGPSHWRHGEQIIIIIIIIIIIMIMLMITIMRIMIMIIMIMIVITVISILLLIILLPIVKIVIVILVIISMVTIVIMTIIIGEQTFGGENLVNHLLAAAAGLSAPPSKSVCVCVRVCA